jgi:hypothetical protein
MAKQFTLKVPGHPRMMSKRPKYPIEKTTQTAGTLKRPANHVVGEGRFQPPSKVATT